MELGSDIYDENILVAGFIQCELFCYSGVKIESSKDEHLCEERRAQLPEGSNFNACTWRGDWHPH